MQITIEQKFNVEYSYPVHFTRLVFNPDNTRLYHTLKKKNAGETSRALMVVDSGLVDATPELRERIIDYFQAHSGAIELVREPLVVPGGENAKNSWNHVREIMTLAGDLHLDRHSFVIGVGGGSVLDMVGFATALVHRGLRLVRLPTTVLAQNDAGIGVKNGMNAGRAKNFVGTFAPPFAVINDSEFLKTLSDSEWTGGLAESFKVAVIKDGNFFHWLALNAARLRTRHQKAMEYAVRLTAELHLRHIATSGDPFEFGSARPLDFGHWSAHQLELISDFTLGHGPAVAIGIALDTTYAMLKRMITREERDAILNAMSACGLPLWSPLLEHSGNRGELDILAGIEQFREHLGGQLSITLPTGLGTSREVHTIDNQCMRKALDNLREWRPLPI